MSRPSPAPPPTRWVVTERVQPGEQGVRWVQLSYAREVAWAASEPPSRGDEEGHGDGGRAQGPSAA